MFWMPLVLQEMTQLGELAIGLVSALPWLGVGTGMVLISRHSDIRQERYRHVGLAALVGSVALLASAWSPSGTVSLLLLFVFGVGLGGAQATFWTIPTALMSRAVAASGVVFINLIGNVSSLINSSVIGFVREQTGSYLWPVMMLAGMLALAAALVAVIALLSSKSHRGV
jgi:ACS family tartrate transporter-like MFS transporter